MADTDIVDDFFNQTDITKNIVDYCVKQIKWIDNSETNDCLMFSERFTVAKASFPCDIYLNKLPIVTSFVWLKIADKKAYVMIDPYNIEEEYDMDYPNITGKKILIDWYKKILEETLERELMKKYGVIKK